MSATTENIDPRVLDYLRSLSRQREGDVLARLREATSGMERAIMQISVEQGRLMALLVRLLGARRCLEVGVFTGYSSLCVAQALPPDGKIVACDVSDQWTSVARKFWHEAGVADRIDLRLAPATETLAALIAAGESGTYDFAFIDADKEGYETYYDQCLTLLRPGGAVAIDNIFMHGHAIEPKPEDADSLAIHRTTQKAFADGRVDPALVPIGDGLLLARKR